MGAMIDESVRRSCVEQKRGRHGWVWSLRKKARSGRDYSQLGKSAHGMTLSPYPPKAEYSSDK
jgi:hypothetical protein